MGCFPYFPFSSPIGYLIGNSPPVVDSGARIPSGFAVPVEDPFFARCGAVSSAFGVSERLPYVFVYRGANLSIFTLKRTFSLWVSISSKRAFITVCIFSEISRMFG